MSRGPVDVGVDLGGTGTRLVRLDRDGVVRAAQNLPTRRDTGARTAVVEDLAARIRDLAGDATLESVGIGASGPVDAGGVIRNDDTLPAYSHIPLAQALGDQLGVPCAIDNDAVAAAIGENTYGAGQRSRSLLTVTLGTGVGVAVLVDGHPVRGGDGSHPEAGHIPVPGGAPCYCGLDSCWEPRASRTALDLATGGATALAAERAVRGEVQAQAVFDRYGAAVGVGLTALVTTFRPDRVVLAGGGARYLSLFVAGLQRSMVRSPGYRWDGPIEPAVLGENSGAIGAAVLGRDLVARDGRDSDRARSLDGPSSTPAGDTRPGDRDGLDPVPPRR